MDEDEGRNTWMMVQNSVSATEFQERIGRGNCFRCSTRHNPAHPCRPTVVNADIMAHIRIQQQANNVEDGKQKKAPLKLRERGINEAPQPYFSSGLILAIREDTFVLMVVDSVKCRNGVPYTLCAQRMVDIGPGVVAAGTGNSMLIEIAMDSIGETGPQQQIADARNMREVAEIFANVINRIFGPLNLSPSVKEEVVMFMLTGYVGQTNDTLVIIQDAETKKFVVREPDDKRICCIGSGDESVMKYMQDHPLPEKWTVEEAKGYCVSCLLEVFAATNSRGGDIRTRTITMAGVEDEERYTKQIKKNGVEGYHLQPRRVV